MGWGHTPACHHCSCGCCYHCWCCLLLDAITPKAVGPWVGLAPNDCCYYYCCCCCSHGLHLLVPSLLVLLLMWMLVPVVAVQVQVRLC